MFHAESGRVDSGHPDFMYLRNRIEEFNLEEKKRNWSIQKTIDRIVESDRERVDCALTCGPKK